MAQGFSKQQPLDTDPTLSGDSDYIAASQKAVKAYVDGQPGGVSNPLTEDLDFAGYEADNVDGIQFELTPESAHAEGMLHWSVDDRTLEFGVGNDVELQIGQETYVMVKNQTGSTLPNGSAIAYDGAVGASGRILGKLAIADGTDPAMTILGIATEDILNGEDGLVTNFGKVRGLDTSGTPYSETWADGDIIYVSPSTAGDLTNVAPTSPDQSIPLAVVVKAHASTGTLYVRVTPLDMNEWATKTELNDHITDATDAHDASAISIVDSGGYFASTEVEAALQELALRTKQMILGNCLNGVVPASSTYYAIPGAVITVQSAAFNMEITAACTISNLRFTATGAQPATGSLVVTVNKNNVNTSLTITVPAGGGSATYSDTTHTVTFAAGDLLVIELKNNATGNSATISRHSLLALFS